MRSRRNISTPAANEAVHQILRYFQERFANEDYAPAMSDMVRLIQYRRDLPDRRSVCVRAGWVRNEKS